MYEGLITEECVCIACYKDLGESEEDKEGTCVLWLFFIAFPNSLVVVFCE